MSNDQAPVLISSLAAGHPAVVFEQVKAYNKAVSDCRHVLHVNNDTVRLGFFDKARAAGIDFGSFGNLTINPTHLFTRRPTFLGAHVLNVEFAMRAGIPFGHVYLHTDADLPFRPGLGEHIRRHDLGLAPSRPVGAGTPRDEAFLAHTDLQKMLEKIGGKFWTIRYEGFFATRAIFYELFFFLMAHIPFDHDNFWRGDYPYEEYLLPTAVEVLHAKNNWRRTRNAVLTANSAPGFNLASRQPIGIEDCARLATLPEDVFAIKFIPDDMASPVRQWIRGQMGYAI